MVETWIIIFVVVAYMVSSYLNNKRVESLQDREVSNLVHLLVHSRSQDLNVYHAFMQVYCMTVTKMLACIFDKFSVVLDDDDDDDTPPSSEVARDPEVPPDV